MLSLYLESSEYFNEKTNEFVTIEGGYFDFEHSLKAISLWEAKHKVPFISSSRTTEELMDYFQCMSVDKPLPKELITEEVALKLASYMEDPQTATTVSDNSKRKDRRIITSEVLYSLMVIAQVPFECENWHLNRLLMLLQVISVETNPNKPKMSKAEILSRNKALNDARRKKYNTKG